MTPFVTLETSRLLLRRWVPADREPFAAINRDPAVMEYYPSPLSPEESDQLTDRIEAHFERHGFGLWAAQLRSTAQLIGFMGLAVPRFRAHFTPCVEIGWRLASTHWGRGLATEGARSVVDYAFNVLELPALVSFTVPANTRSRRVMEKLRMTHNPADDFEHPEIPAGHSLRPHVLYRLDRAARNTNHSPSISERSLPSAGE